MKKRIFAGIAAVALAATCAVGATACDFFGSSGPDNSVNSESKWQEAWRDTSRMSSYTVTAVITGFTDYGNGKSEEYKYGGELRYDYTHQTAYYKTVEEEHYYGYLSGEGYVDYANINGKWVKQSMDYSFDRLNYADYLCDIEITIYDKDSDEWFGGSFRHMYEFATYNSSTKTYTLDCLAEYESSTTIKYDIQFNKGRVYKVVSTVTEEGKSPVITTTEFSNINSTTVTIPDSVTGKGETPGTGTVTPPDKVTTEAEWKQALAATAAATSYKVTGTMEVTTTQGDSSFQSKNEVAGSMISLYDGVSGVLYNYEYRDMTTTITVNGNTTVTPSVYENEVYLEVAGTNVDTYYKTISVIDSGIWKKSTENLNTAQEASDYLAKQGIIGGSMIAGYKASEESEVESLDELFNLFTYDAATGIYTATLTMDTEIIEIENVKIYLKFVDGMLYSLGSEYTSVQSGVVITTKTDYVFTDYNSTTASVPAEVKAAVQ